MNTTRKLQDLTKAALVAAALTAVLSGCGGGGESGSVAIDAPCQRHRVDVIDVSSSARSSEHLDEAAAVLTAELIGAAVCGDEIDASAVAGGHSQPVLSSADIEELHLSLPTKRAIEHRIAGTHDTIEKHVRTKLDAAITALGSADSSPIEHLYDVANELGEADGRVVLITDGVEQVDGLNLDRDLADGEGARLAQGVKVPRLPSGTTVVVAGIGQMDTASAAPGAVWVREVTSFNQVLCDRAADSCVLLTSLAVPQIVDA